MENMEINVGGGEEEEAMELPPGFRFHPTDEELITDYLCLKVLDNGFVARAIGEVDLNKSEPWELPSRAKMGEKEWYFFCVRDRKYPTGLRTNRATECGYWKATGKDKEIFREKSLVGMKKTLVFYKGRAPKGQKTNWVMHEYRLDGDISLRNLPSNAKNEWTICRVFEKNEAGRKIPLSELMIPNSYNNTSGNLPALMESSPYNTTTTTNNDVPNNNNGPYVPCFSNPVNNNNHLFTYDGFTSSRFDSIPSQFQDSNYYLQPQTSQFQMNYLMSDQNLLRAILDCHGTEVKQSMKTEELNYSASQDTGLSSDMNPEISSNYDFRSKSFYGPSTSGGPIDLDNLWNY